MLNFLRPELKTQKTNLQTHQSPIRNQPENSTRKRPPEGGL